MMQKKTTVISLFSKLVVTVTASLRANLFHLPTEQISIANKQNTTPVLPLSHLYSWVLLDISWNSSRPVGEGVPPHHGQTLSGGLSGQVQLANSRLRLGFCQVKKKLTFFTRWWKTPRPQHRCSFALPSPGSTGARTVHQDSPRFDESDGIFHLASWQRRVLRTTATKRETVFRTCTCFSVQFCRYWMT